jgi:hypothetical protein
MIIINGLFPNSLIYNKSNITIDKNIKSLIYQKLVVTCIHYNIYNYYNLEDYLIFICLVYDIPNKNDYYYPFPDQNLINLIWSYVNNEKLHRF